MGSVIRDRDIKYGIQGRCRYRVRRTATSPWPTVLAGGSSQACHILQELNEPSGPRGDSHEKFVFKTRPWPQIWNQRLSNLLLQPSRHGRVCTPDLESMLLVTASRLEGSAKSQVSLGRKSTEDDESSCKLDAMLLLDLATEIADEIPR